MGLSVWLIFGYEVYMSILAHTLTHTHDSKFVTEFKFKFFFLTEALSLGV